jgi:membrane fusion protein, copper/silver efflux system
MKNYRNAFIATLVVAIAFAAGLGFVGWRYVLHCGQASMTGPQPSPSAAASPAQPESESADAPAAGAPPQQTPLAPIQLSPQRLQSIGVTSGAVETKDLFNEVRAVGNVAVDERLQAYVQTRFSGWIQKVYADTTYQYVRKGQPLFTIYSPDLVTTEQEYLLARKNRDLLAASTVPGVASGANSLLDAAQERLKQWEIPSGRFNTSMRRGRFDTSLKLILPFRDTSLSATRFPTCMSSPPHASIPSRTSQPYGSTRRCFKMKWDNSRSAIRLP